MTNIDRRFATALKTLHDAPSSMAQAIRRQEGMSEHPDVLIFSPDFTTMDIHRPASLLALTATHWAVAINTGQSADKAATAGTVSAVGSAFNRTLIVDLSILLLDGRLAIHGAGRNSAAYVIYFNTVMEKIYREAAFYALNRIVAAAGPSGEATAQNRPVTHASLAMKFQSALERFTPPGRTIVSYVAWPAVIGGFHRLISPAAMLVRTESELILVSDEGPSAGHVHGPRQNLGYVVTYMPLNRIQAVTCHPGPKLTAMEMAMAVENTAESITLLIPPDTTADVKSVAVGTR